MRKKEILHKIQETNLKISAIEKALAKIETLLIVRDPGNALSADAYDALRRTVLLAAKARRSHIGHLISLKDGYERGLSASDLGHRIDECVSELGLVYSSDYTIEGAFEVIGGDGNQIEVIRPALLDVAEGNVVSIIRQGQVRVRGGHVVLPNADLENEIRTTDHDSTEIVADWQGHLHDPAGADSHTASGPDAPASANELNEKDGSH